LTQFVVDLTRHERALLFTHVLKAASESAEPLERGPQFLFDVLPLCDFYSKFIIDSGESGRPLLDAAFQLVVRFPQAFHLLPAFRQIASQFREPPKVPLRVAQGRDHHVCPKTRTVFAYSPALVLALPLAHRFFKVPVRSPTLLIVRLVENGKVL